MLFFYSVSELCIYFLSHPLCALNKIVQFLTHRENVELGSLGGVLEPEEGTSKDHLVKPLAMRRDIFN